MKKLMMDESHRVPNYLKYTAIFNCGCSYSNASWANKEQCIASCPEHNQTKSAIITHLTCGIRPKNAETLKSSLKANLSALKSQLSESVGKK